MINAFSSWLPPKPIPAAEGEDVLTPLARGRDQPAMTPVDRSVTPRAPLGPQEQLTAPKASYQEHAREASDATLNGRPGRYPSTASSLGPHLQRLTDDAMEAHHRLHHEADESYGHLSDPSASRRSSSAAGPNTVFSSTLGGVDSEAAWSDAHGRSDTQTTNSRNASAPRRKRKIAPPELLVIVRPPPSKQINPLNLQIQLVMPSQRREASSRRKSGESTRSQDSSPTAAPARLKRSGSTVSDKSRSSEISTAASTTSSSSAKRVMPLYNLGFHSILSSVVTDAGTDQKVAKYTKKGVDLDGFGLLEPAELVTGVNDLATLYRSGLSGSAAAMGEGRAVGSIGSDEGLSVVSAPAQEQPAAAARPTHLEPPTSFQAMTPEAKGQESNLGGKLLGRFKRLSMGMRPATGQAPGGSASTAAGQSVSGGARVFDKLAARVSGDAGSVSFAAPLTGGDIPQLTPGAGVAGGKRTEGYYWTVRRWNRRAQDGIQNSANPELLPDGSNPVLNSVWKRFNLINRMGGNERHPAPRDIPIRIEWSRETRRAHKRRATEEARARIRASASLNASRSSLERHQHQQQHQQQHEGQALSNGHGNMPSVSGSSTSLHGGSDGSLHPPAAGARLPPSRRNSSMSGAMSPRRSLDHSAASSSGLGDHETHDDDDGGDESDPEDSETPWSCHLVLGPTTRIPIGTLSPAPHHPKLVGQLAVPFPLPDLGATGLGHDGAGLTREELKDIIMVTCLHLIVRENFGGMVKKRGRSRPATSSGHGA
ncbi:uncharacterized protein PSFLO_02494 [Pseudozyma flocculosa]|uniref:Uncharacterized protein n=2 Tax=Pseudozyma flocculosa TaxID=84751 RepID=A0A5C3EY43_9BASI|nr:uncharacterized protein PSFLO_02494 [Pseudozyma flocculosa]